MQYSRRQLGLRRVGACFHESTALVAPVVCRAGYCSLSALPRPGGGLSAPGGRDNLINVTKFKASTANQTCEAKTNLAEHHFFVKFSSLLVISAERAASPERRRKSCPASL
ncbi:hypothetical protein E2C01_014164 [Portunus trituberculatus]|uniref:Uncharacterized protein n=1 Tax=Portunus trituberculatus TaxID=210409 RepID=A0A5B7DJ23_PORTR|nr:hypothetical protein [Portunus trituberculatus]